MKKRGSIGILARTGSQRLNNKHFKEIDNIPILSYLIARIQNNINDRENNIVILTGNEKENKNLDKIAVENNVDIYFGDDNNIPKRLYEYMVYNKIDYIISIDGDDILCSPEAVKLLINELNNGEDYVKTINLPLGMNVIGLSKIFLNQAISNFNNLDNCETGWEWVLNRNFCKKIKVSVENEEEYNKLRFTLDYEEDFEFFKKVIMKINDIKNETTQNIINDVIKNNYYLINNHMEKAYWKNFNEENNKELNENG